MKTEVRYLALSDIHLGNHRNATEDLIRQLKVFLNDPFFKENLDILFLIGDVFDRAIYLHQDECFLVMRFIDWLFEYCVQHNVVLRVVEGTPSHDWAQSRLFKEMAELKPTQLYWKDKLQAQYVDTLSIEIIEPFGLSVLYVPDEWRTTASETFEEVKILLKEKGLSKVDIAMMHGQFVYQLPGEISKLSHREEDYLDIVDRFISVGHIHTHNPRGRIIPQGSFGRYAHGEEEDKGGVYFHLQPNREDRWLFVKNKLATIYKTLNVPSTLPLEEIIPWIDKKTQKYPDKSHIRLKADKTHPLFSSFTDLKKEFARFHLTKTPKDKGKDENQAKSTVMSKHEALPLTKETLLPLVLGEIQLKAQLSPNQVRFLETLF